MAKRSPDTVDKYVGSRVRMRRMMLGMSQERLGDALDLTFQQIQKYEKGTNRIGAGRLYQLSAVLQVPIPFFFEGAPQGSSPKIAGDAPSALDVAAHMATADGLELTLAFMSIKDPRLRRRIVDLVVHLVEKHGDAVRITTRRRRPRRG